MSNPLLRTCTCLAIVVLGAAAVPLRAQGSANFGFEERSLVDPARPARWSTGGGAGFAFALDSAAAHGGRFSLRISRDPTGSGFAVANQTIPIALARGKRVRLRGWIRTADVTTGQAAFWMRVDGPANRPLAFDNMMGRGAKGTTPWTRYEIELPVDSAATGVMFGALYAGDGSVWYDDVEIALDGVPFDPASIRAWEPAPAQAAWVRRHAISLATDDPTAGDADLRALHPLVEGARIVALGEATHGTREFFRAKHRLVRWMVEREGVTVFAIEANMPEARRVNEYVLTGRGDPRAALAGLYFWTWNTEEVLALIEWMRAYNASGRGRVEFWGFDMQYASVAADSVRAFVARADPAFLPTVDSAYALADSATAGMRRGRPAVAAMAPAWRDAAARVVAHLAANRASYLTRFDSMQVAWAEQNARIVEQAASMDLPNGASRDSSMAVNVAWIVAHQPPGTRIALWAHNGHVARDGAWMGGYLDRRFGSAYRVFGFAFGEGDYTAVGSRGLRAYPAAAPAPGSVESVLRRVGMPRLVLDLRGAARERDGAWLAEPHLFREIGAGAMDVQFIERRVAGRFDALIYFDHTTPSRLLPRPGR
ncbi:MAG TPA: erythromycin esterase family protein [Longimicrobium sp.]